MSKALKNGYTEIIEYLELSGSTFTGMNIF